jgi:UDP-N-acetylmuramoyl-tripeptide--D-alanyl-D-alanine ligase
MMNIKDLYSIYTKAGAVSTDTRKIMPGSLFVALKGDTFNANEFAAEALEKGAVHAVVDDPVFAIDDRFTLVENGLAALQELAAYHRTQLKIPVVGLTGSNGKTTTKELLNAVLSVGYKTFATQGNLNNHIGVPLTLLSIGSDVELAIVEMGANHVGEIARLCEIANPTHGLITNIGKAHIGTFGGFDNIIRGKKELYQHLLQHQGTVFINSQNEVLSTSAKLFNNPVFYPAKGDFYYARMVSADPFVRVQTENGDEFDTQLIGAYNFENVACALCVGKFFGIDAKAANRAVAAYAPANMRSQVMKKGGNTIILDAYNANPTSMQAAIENLAAMKAPRKILILGDMFELEEESQKEHRLIGALIAERNFKEVYLVGEHMRYAKELIPFAKHYAKKEELMRELSHNLITNATILIKASRSVGLESVVEVV